MAKVASQLGCCSVALRAVPVLREAETTLSSTSPRLSSLETLQPLNQVFFLKALFSPLSLPTKMHTFFSQTFPLSSDFLWKRRKTRAIMNLALDNSCLLYFPDSYNCYRLTRNAQINTSGPIPETSI